MRIELEIVDSGDKEEESNWNDIPRDLLDLVSKRLPSVADHLRFSGVCSWWREVGKDDRRRFKGRLLFPGLILCYDAWSPYVDSYAPFLPFKKISEFVRNQGSIFSDLPWISHQRLPRNGRCIGSYQGWLICRHRRFLKSDPYSISISNPTTDSRHTLPRVYGSIPIKVILSSKPTVTNCCVFLVCLDNTMHYFKYGEKDWNTLDFDVDWIHEEDDQKSLKIADVFWYKKSLYVLRCNGHISRFDDLSYVPNPSFLAKEAPRRPSEVVQVYFAEVSGELLLVYREKRACEVYKLDSNGERWIKVTSLGANSLFLGQNQAFAVSQKEFSDMLPNHIYYTCEETNEIGDFGLENSSFGSIDADLPLNPKTGLIWYSPTYVV